MRLVLVVQRRGVGEPEKYLKSELLLTEGGIIGAQRIPQVSIGQREEVCKRTHGSLESRHEILVKSFGKDEVMGVDEAG